MSNSDSTASGDASESEANPDATPTDDAAGVPDEEREQLEKERAERLDPNNRPKNAEVDNSGREWDSEKEEFKYAAGEEPGAQERTSAIIGADWPKTVENERDEN
ncbi:MAG TPA: hypothetical protein VE174_15065 [Actinomycetota bacterium]|nr:hypothetical protein [Actinomycetota bacterium]